MIHKSYFKSTTYGINPDTQRCVTVSNTFFFDERSPDLVRAAYEDAKANAERMHGKVSVWKKPWISGPWDDVPVVGEGIGEFSTEPN